MSRVKGKPIDKTTKDLVNWDEELAKAAEESAKTAAAHNKGSVKSITIKSGILSIDGNPVPGNALVGVISTFVMHNTYFAGMKYDPDNPVSPVCYAYGKTEDEMGPHDEAETKQNETCEDCEFNAFGSDDRGNGKACKNTFKLLVLPVGEYDHKGDSFEAPDSEEEFLEAEAHTFKVPPTSLKFFSKYIESLKAKLRPEWSVYTKITVVPDPKNQFAITFQHVDNIPSNLLQAVKTKHQEGEKEIIVAYPKNSEREERKEKQSKNKKPMNDRRARSGR